MDNVTHSVIGWVLNRAGLNRLTPHALPVILLASNIPDGDIVLALGGGLLYFENHRLWTHTWLLWPVMATLPVLLVWPFARKTLKWLPAYLISLVGVAAHILMDWCNAYPTRFAAPFSSHEFHLDLLNIVDPWLLLGLGLVLVAPLLSRLVNDEIGARRGSGQGMAVAGVLFLFAWIGFHALLHSRAVAPLEGYLYNQEPPRRMAAFPTINPFVWDTVVETESAFFKQTIHLAREYDPQAGKVWFKPPLSPALLAARATEPFRFFQYFAAFPLWRLVPVAQGTRVDLIDLRFGTPQNPAFHASATVDAAGRVIEDEFHFARPRP